MKRGRTAVLVLTALACSRAKLAPSVELEERGRPATSATSASAPSALPALAADERQVSRDPKLAAETAIEVPRDQIHEPGDLKSGERRPLLILLHGLGASGKAAIELPGLRSFAKRQRLFVVAPDGTLDGAGRRFWNAHAACCNFEGRQVDDVARLGTLVKAWSEKPGVDPRRIYVVGFSNGGFMAHRLACRLGDKIAGVVSVAGAGPKKSEACTIQGPLAVLEIHGDDDDIVSYEGGSVFGKARYGRHASARETLADWATRLECRGEPKALSRLDLNRKLAGSETEPLSLESCRHGKTALWTVNGGNHYIGSDPALMEQAWRYLEGSRK